MSFHFKLCTSSIFVSDISKIYNLSLARTITDTVYVEMSETYFVCIFYLHFYHVLQVHMRYTIKYVPKYYLSRLIYLYAYGDIFEVHGDCEDICIVKVLGILVWKVLWGHVCGKRVIGALLRHAFGYTFVGTYICMGICFWGRLWDHVYTNMLMGTCGKRIVGPYNHFPICTKNMFLGI